MNAAAANSICKPRIENLGPILWACSGLRSDTSQLNQIMQLLTKRRGSSLDRHYRVPAGTALPLFIPVKTTYASGRSAALSGTSRPVRKCMAISLGLYFWVSPIMAAPLLLHLCQINILVCQVADDAFHIIKADVSDLC